MKKVLVLLVGATVLASARTAVAVPVVPNFTQEIDDFKHGNDFYRDRSYKFDEL